MLYTADEMFMTGTAVEVTPVRSVDRIAVGKGKVGPVTRKIQKAFANITQQGEDPYGWLTFVPNGTKKKSAPKAAKKTARKRATTKKTKRTK